MCAARLPAPCAGKLRLEGWLVVLHAPCCLGMPTHPGYSFGAEAPNESLPRKGQLRYLLSRIQLLRRKSAGQRPRAALTQPTLHGGPWAICPGLCWPVAGEGVPCGCLVVAVASPLPLAAPPCPPAFPLPPGRAVVRSLCSLKKGGLLGGGGCLQLFAGKLGGGLRAALARGAVLRSAPPVAPAPDRVPGRADGPPACLSGRDGSRRLTAFLAGKRSDASPLAGTGSPPPLPGGGPPIPPRGLDG